MHKHLYKFAFTCPTDMSQVEQTLLLAILAVSCLHGSAAMRLDAGYSVDHDKRVMVVDASTEVGRDVTCVFAGLCTHEFGDGAFRVEAVRSATPVGTVAA